MACALLLLPASLPRPTGERSPGSASGTPETGLDCDELFEEFCGGAGAGPEPGGELRDPTGRFVDEEQAEEQVRSLRLSHTDWISRIYTPSRRQNLSEIQQWVRSRLVAWVKAQGDPVFSSRDRRELLARIRGVEVDFPDPVSGFRGENELLGEHSAFYEQGRSGSLSFRRIRLGGAYVLGVSSLYNLVFTLAHETAHSIDPCELRRSGWTPPALERLNACFLQEGLVQVPDSRQECRHDDQLSETFADWLAVEVLVQALEKNGARYTEAERRASVRNSIRDLCTQNDSQWHPHARVRIERVLGAHPGIRRYLGCPASDQKTCRLGDR